jgi:hypothetical protein
LATPAIALSRTNGSVAPDRLTTMSCICSIVVNRFSQAEQVRRRRIAPPSSATRLSSTLVSVCLQNGQCIEALLPGGREGYCLGTKLWTGLCSHAVSCA